ncbi:ATP-binding protein [Desulfolithobacter sp.]
MFERRVVSDVMQGLQRTKKLLHIIIGPRQVGKTTAAQQIADKWPGEVLTFSADSPIPPGPEWIQGNWDRAVRLAESEKGKNDVLLILDEIQKVRGWSEVVKLLWDVEMKNNAGLQVLLLGSSSLLLQQGLTESLSGRFFLYRCSHWQYPEMKEAFGWNLDQWIFYGGYPGAAEMIDEEEAWSAYVTDSLIETVLAKDILQLQTVAKPALLRHLFLLACTTPSQVLSYNKMLGQLHDAGNTTTLAHYLKLLESAFLVSGLELFKRGKQKKRGSSPKLILWNNALVNAVTGDSFSESRANLSWWGRLVENAVGAHILNSLAGRPFTLYYWRARHLEVDFVLETPKATWAIEVKSGKSATMKGLTKFCDHYPETHPLIIGPGGLDLESFFASRPVTDW